MVRSCPLSRAVAFACCGGLRLEVHVGSAIQLSYLLYTIELVRLRLGCDSRDPTVGGHSSSHLLALGLALLRAYWQLTGPTRPE